MNRIGLLPGSAARAVLAGAVLGLIACGEPGPRSGPPASITKSADAQSAVVGTLVPVDPAVTVRDVDGKPVPNVTVTFIVASGGGSITGGDATTDRQGIATVESWMLGTIAGANSLAAFIAGLPSVIFRATALPAPASTISKRSIDPACAPAGGNVDSIAVHITDRFGNVLAGETVTFAVTAGGGSVSPVTQVTQADGRAAARWTLGTSTGDPNTATATRAGLATPTVSFSVSTVEPVEQIRFASTVAVVDSLATFTPTMSIIGRFGNPVECAPVALTVRQGLIATVAGSAITARRTGQTFLIAASTENQSARDSVLVVVANVASPVVTASVPRFDLKADTTFTVPVIVDMRASPEKLGAATLQVGWDPMVLTYVGESEGGAGAGATVNASAAPLGSLTLAMASGSGFSGAVEVRRLSFKASSTAARSGSLTVTVIDLAGAETLASLVPRTISVFYPLRTR